MEKRFIGEIIVILDVRYLSNVCQLLLEKYTISLIIEHLSHTNIPHFINEVSLLNYIVHSSVTYDSLRKMLYTVVKCSVLLNIIKKVPHC